MPSGMHNGGIFNARGNEMKLQEAPTSSILAEIKKFQNAQKRYPATIEIHAEIGKQLAPLFREMARRQAFGTNGKMGLA